jgi:membrane associated rhomboid family serine protease
MRTILSLAHTAAALRIPHPPPQISCATFLCRRSSSSPRYNGIVSLCSRQENNNDDDDVTTINASEFIDFDKIDNKLFDDLQDYGTIRSLESPYENYEPMDPLSVDEIELWMEKNNLRNKRQQQKRRWSTLFPWISPLTSLILPRRHLAPTDQSSRWKTKVDNTRRTSNNLNNDYFTSSTLIRGFLSTPNSARNLLISINIASYLYQIITAVWYLPGFNRVLAASVAGNAYTASTLLSNNNKIIQWTPMEVVLRALGLVGGGAGVVIASSGSTMRGVMGKGIVRRGPIAAHSMGPYFLDFAHQPYPLSSYQKHRYLSSGFLHGSLLHLGMNLRALLSIPLWLENGIGKGVYLSAYLVAIVTGNIAQTLFTIGDLSGRSASSLCIGASGGICGLYGLMLSSLLKMRNADAAYYVLKNMAWLLLFGNLVPNVSNSGHLGGLVGGVLVGYLFGPGYERSYSLNRADGFARDKADPEFRQMMGPGIYPSLEKAIFPLKYLWMCVGLAIVARPELRLMPIDLVRGILEPGSLSGARVLLRNV